MKNKVILAVAAAIAGAVVGGCSSNEKVHLENCQKITENLLGQKVSWVKHSQHQDETELRVDLVYKTSVGDEGRVSCSFGPNPDDDDAGFTPREFNHAPERVTINDRPVDQRSLVKATLEVTRDAVVAGANRAAEKSREAVARAAEVSGVVKEKARQAVVDTATKVQDALKRKD